MDTTIQRAKRLFATEPTLENEARLEEAYLRAGFKRAYIACKRCNPQTRCVGRGRNVSLCPDCCGQGWTDTEWVAP